METAASYYWSQTNGGFEVTYESKKRTNDPDYLERKKLFALEVSELKEEDRKDE